MQLVHDAARKRYRLEVDGIEVAFGEVDPVGADSMLLKHTEVPSQFEGKGYGGTLVRMILEKARDEGKTVIPVCPFAAGWVKRHPEYASVLREDVRGRP